MKMSGITNEQAEVAGAPIVDVDLFTDESMTNPEEVHRRLRAAGPVVWLPRHQTFYVVDWKIGREIFLNWEDFSSAQGIGVISSADFAASRKPGILLESDPPEHDKFRSVISRILSPAALKSMRTAFEERADELIDAALEKRFVDASADLVLPFVTDGISNAVGVPDVGRENLLIYGEMVVNMTGPANERTNKSIERARSSGAADWVNSMMCRGSLRDNGLAAEIFAQSDLGKITEAEAEMLVRIFLSAAVDSTAYTLINGIKNFCDHPHQWDLLHAQPELFRCAFEEVLRYNVSVQVLHRVATRNLEIGGVAIKKGDRIGVGMRAAGRDPVRFPDPDRFDILRKSTGHLAFGAGIHGCAGQMVARMEAEILYGKLARRVAKISPAGEAVPFFNNAISSWSPLPVELTPK